jgi:sarcosine oxidase subunit beta
MHMITSSSYQTVKFHPELITDETIKRTGYTFALEQTEAGTILINGTREFAEFDKGISFDGIRLMIQGAAKVYPCLKDLHVMRMFAGLRPYTPDGLPIVGPLGDLEGFLMACGHEGDGIALSPITGRIVTDLICQGQAAFDINPLSSQRFLTH